MGEEAAVFNAMVHPRRPLHIMVEPDPENAAAIRVEHNQRLLHCAIASEPGKREFHRSWDEAAQVCASGSILKPTGHIEACPNVEFTGIVEVDCCTLDDLFDSQGLTRIDLLWVDIQGGERGMIEGGRKALAHTRFCFMEVELREMYEDQALRDELLTLMDGWELVGDFPPNVLLKNTRFQ